MKYKRIGEKVLKPKEELTCVGKSSARSNSFLLNLLAIHKEHKERAVQTEKRISKLNWLIRNIPMIGANAMEILKERKK
jgi:hypothetical protein